VLNHQGRPVIVDTVWVRHFADEKRNSWCI